MNVKCVRSAALQRIGKVGLYIRSCNIWFAGKTNITLQVSSERQGSVVVEVLLLGPIKQGCKLKAGLLAS